MEYNVCIRHITWFENVLISCILTFNQNCFPPYFVIVNYSEIYVAM